MNRVSFSDNASEYFALAHNGNSRNGTFQHSDCDFENDNPLFRGVLARVSKSFVEQLQFQALIFRNATEAACLPSPPELTPATLLIQRAFGLKEALGLSRLVQA